MASIFFIPNVLRSVQEFIDFNGAKDNTQFMCQIANARSLCDPWWLPAFIASESAGIGDSLRKKRAQ
jgi:hypothetical protein